MQTAWTYNNFISGSGKQCLGATQPCFACWGESPIPKISEMCWLRILKNAPKQSGVLHTNRMLNCGLYEQVINNQLNSELSEIPEARKTVVPIDKAEASKVLAQYLADVVQKGLDNVVDENTFFFRNMLRNNIDFSQLLMYNKKTS